MTTSIQTHISNGGRIVIPIEYRKALGLDEGDAVTMNMDEFGIHISTPLSGLRRLQAAARARIPKGVLLSEELIADRRADAKREIEELEAHGKKPKS